MLKTLDVLFLNRDDVVSLLSYADCIPLMETAMRSVSGGQAQQPIRTSLQIPESTRVLGDMPGYVQSPETFGVKVVSVFPDNFGTSYGSHQGLVTLYDAHNGAPYALIDGGAITAIRTAATTAAATKHLARENAECLTILGYGEQAATHVQAIKEICAIERIKIWGRSIEKAQAFARLQEETHSLSVEAVESAEDAISTADIVCTTTGASTPIVSGDWLPNGVHVNLIGSSVATMREIDNAGLKKAKFYCDYKASLEVLGGEYLHALADGAITEDHLVGEVGQVILGTCPGRETQDEITMFKSLGMVSEDLLAAQYVYEKAIARGVGQQLSM